MQQQTSVANIRLGNLIDANPIVDENDYESDTESISSYHSGRTDSSSRAAQQYYNTTDSDDSPVEQFVDPYGTFVDPYANMFGDPLYHRILADAVLEQTGDPFSLEPTDSDLDFEL